MYFSFQLLWWSQIHLFWVRPGLLHLISVKVAKRKVKRISNCGTWDNKVKDFTVKLKCWSPAIRTVERSNHCYVANSKQCCKRVEERLALIQREGLTAQRAWSFIHSAKHTHTHMLCKAVLRLREKRGAEERTVRSLSKLPTLTSNSFTANFLFTPSIWQHVQNAFCV